MITVRGWTLMRPQETKNIAGALMMGQVIQQTALEAGENSTRCMLDLIKVNDMLAQALVSIDCECEHDTMGDLVVCERCRALAGVRAQMEEHGLWDPQ